MCVPPFKIAFYHLGAMVHIETNCYNTSRFFSRKFMCVHELYIFFNKKILHFGQKMVKIKSWFWSNFTGRFQSCPGTKIAKLYNF